MSQGGDFRRDIVASHERFADENCIGPPIKDLLRIFAGFDATFADEDEMVVNLDAQRLGGREVDLERLQIAIIHSDNTSFGIERAVELFFIVDLDEDVQLTHVRDF